MKNIDYISDAGILFSSEETKYFIQTDTIQEFFEIKKDENLVKFIFTSSNNRENIKRKYLRIEDVLSKVGGFLKSITLIWNIFNYFYSYINFYILLMNKLYFFDFDEIIKTKEPSNSKNYIGNYDNSMRMRDKEKKIDFDNFEMKSKKNNNQNKSDFNNENTPNKLIYNDSNIYLN